jgi:hypothetical protein
MGRAGLATVLKLAGRPMRRVLKGKKLSRSSGWITPVHGAVVQGTLTDASLVNALKGKTIYDLYQYAANNQLYVNVHNKMNPEVGTR